MKQRCFYWVKVGGIDCLYVFSYLYMPSLWMCFIYFYLKYEKCYHRQIHSILLPRCSTFLISVYFNVCNKSKFDYDCTGKQTKNSTKTLFPFQVHKLFLCLTCASSARACVLPLSLRSRLCMALWEKARGRVSWPTWPSPALLSDTRPGPTPPFSSTEWGSIRGQKEKC